MEPFFLRCETCQARLRVRDERFLGQVQSCPKCGSMVQILAPAGWLATGEAAPATDAAEVAAAEAPTLIARVASSTRDQAALWTAGTATALVTCGLLGFLALRGDDEVASPPPSARLVATPVVKQVDAPAAAIVPPPTQGIAERVSAENEPATTIPATPSAPDTVAKSDEPAPRVVSPPIAMQEPVAAAERPRTLTLEPVHESTAAMSATDVATVMPDYPPAVEVEPAVAEAKSPLGQELGSERQAAAASARVTNFKDQLSVPIESIDLPAMPIGEFVNLVSSMAAVPIKLDPKVLGDVGMSSRSTVSVRGDHTTVGKLLAGVLKEHQLTCVERDGALVVVKAKP